MPFLSSKLQFIFQNEVSPVEAGNQSLEATEEGEEADTALERNISDRPQRPQGLKGEEEENHFKWALIGWSHRV